MSHKKIQSRHNSQEQTRKLVMLALFTAVAYLSIYIIHFRVSFLTFEFKNVFITIAAMLFGPVAGGVISLITAYLEMVFFSTTDFYGFIMNFISSASFSMVAAYIYRGRRTQISSYVSLAVATLSSTALMLVANLIVTPFFMGTTMTEVALLIPKMIFPFNLIKCIANAALVLLFYKPITVVLRRAKMIPGEEKNKAYFNHRTLLSIIVACALMVISFVVLFLALDGSIVFGK